MVEQLGYTIKERIGEIEIRHYPKHVIAVVEGLGDNSAFGYLFRYISGDNISGENIEMTAPVITSQKIKMTVPVISQSGFMAFVLPSKFTIENAPKPLEPRVHLVERKGKNVAILRFRGRAGENQVDIKTKELLSILKKHHRSIIGEPFLMRYNPPFIPGFLRRNEIGVEIE